MGQVTGRPLGCNASPGQPAPVGLGFSSQRAGGSCPQCLAHSHTWQAMGVPTGAELPVREGPGSVTPTGSRPLQPTGTLWEHIPHQGTTAAPSVGALALSLTCTSGHLSSPTSLSCWGSRTTGAGVATRNPHSKNVFSACPRWTCSFFFPFSLFIKSKHKCPGAS